ncbi:MAG: hypothetical protein NVS9B12_01000 [Vulcanimicrobiaceae bacterium]
MIDTLTDRAAKVESYRYLLERAHYSYYALLPEWRFYQDFDASLTALGAHVFLLWIPPEQLKSRSLYRTERRGWAQGFLKLHGDERKALETFSAVQERRYEGIKRSGIPHTLIDTSQKDWDSYSNLIAEVSY